MRISTSLYFDQSSQQMSSAATSLNQDQAQLSSGKQFVQPSDAPDKVALVTQIQSQLSIQTTYQNTLTSLNNRLTSQETALKSANTTLSRIQTLAEQAANGTLTDSDRKTVANEIAGMRDQLLSLANTQDSEGNYLFSGSKMNTPSFGKDANGQTVYQGDTSTMKVNVGDNRQLSINMAGTSAFVNVQRTDSQGNKSGVSFFQSLDDLTAAVQNSDTANIQKGIGELSTLEQGVSNGLAQVGTNESVVDMQNTVLSQVVLNLQTSLSNAQDLDYNTAVTKMNQDQLALEAAQNSFAKISQNNLFKYLG
jgi:flagellar hook-associated protein 3 FlgL